MDNGAEEEPEARQARGGGATWKPGSTAVGGEGAACAPRGQDRERAGQGGEGAVGSGLSGPRGKIEVGKQQINTVSHM